MTQRMHSFFRSKTGMVLISTIVSVVLSVGAYEIYKNAEYYRWRETFTGNGRFGKITIPSENPILMWEYKPYGHFRRLKTNRYGFRDIDYPTVAKPTNTRRIAFAGDSVTLGHRTGFKRTFVRQFEQKANEMNLEEKIQALNFGVDSYNTPQILEMIRTKVLEFSPDKLVYVMCLNDFDFKDSSGSKILYFKKPASFFLELIEKTYRRSLNIDFHQFHFDKTKDVVFQNILDMKELLEDEGIDFQMVIVPIFPRSFEEYPIKEIPKQIGEFLNKNSISFVDLHDPFFLSGKSPRYYSFDIWHPNARGHRLIASEILLPVLEM